MIKIDQIFRAIVLNPNVIETERVELNELKNEEYGRSYQNSKMRIECHNNDENDSYLEIEVFGKEEPANRIIIRKQVEELKEWEEVLETMTFELSIPDGRKLGNIVFKNGSSIEVSTLNRHIEFRQNIEYGPAGIIVDDSKEEVAVFTGVRYCVYSTEFALEEIRDAMCDISVFSGDYMLYTKCINNMLDLIEPALALNILVFNEKLLNRIEGSRSYKDGVEDDYHYFLETFESEVPNTIKVKK